MAWLFETVPAFLRLLLALALFIGITVFIVWRFHDRILALSNGDPWPPEDEPDDDQDGSTAGEGEETAILAEDDESGEQSADESDEPRRRPARHHDEDDDEEEDEGPRKPPKPFYLAGRIMAITMTAFVFLLAFTLNNFWGNSQDARVAVEEESGDYQSLLIAAESLPEGPHKDAVTAAVKNYGDTVVQQEWPLLIQADSADALPLHLRAGRDLAKATLLAEVPEETKSTTAWSIFTDTVPDMVQQGTDRIHQLPRHQAPGVIGLIFLLAILNLAVTAAYQPAPLVQNVVLMGLMAGIVGLLLFILVEASNPFAGSGALTPATFLP